MAVAFILLTAYPAYAAIAPASVTDDPLRQAPDTALTPPVLTAQVGEDAIELRWDPVPGAVRYQLRVWWDTLSTWQPLAELDAPTASYTHTDPTPGREYHYTIRAVNAAGQASDWQQNFPSATVPAGSDASPPTPTPTSTPITSASPTATPTPTSTPITSATPTATPTLTSTPITSASPTATPTSTSTPITSASPTATPTLASTPSASPLTPPVLTAEAVDSAIQLRWHAVPGAARYQMRVWWDTLPSWQSLAEVDSTATAYTHTDVTPGRIYYYTIRVVNAAGQTSDWQQDFPDATVPAGSDTALPTSTPTFTPSASPSPTPTPTTTPSPAASPLYPPALTATAVENAIELRWDPVPGAVRYRLKVWWDPLPKWQPIAGDGTSATSYTHTGVKVGREYFYTIQAVNAAGQESDWQLDYASATITDTPVSPQRVAPPPAFLELDPYYRKYLDAGGIPVLASSDVDDAELYHARDIIAAMLSDRPDLLANMAANRFRVIIYENDGCRGPFQVPELRDDLPPGRCTQTVGIASIKGRANRFTGEMFLVIEAIGVAPAILPYCNFIFVHEFAHLVDYALSYQLPGTTVFDPGFDARVQSAYSAAISAGLYQDAYAATSHLEYWAEAVTFWFLPDMLTGLVRTPAHVSKLAHYDPHAARLVEEVFGDAALPDCNPVFFRLLGTVTGPGGEPLAGVTVVTDVRAVPELSPNFWHFTEETLPTRAGGAFVVTVSKPKLARFQRFVRQETGKSSLASHLILGVAGAESGACPSGYLSSAGGKVENIPSRSAAQFTIPTGDLSGISLTLAPNFVWTQPACLTSNGPLPIDEN